MCESCSSEVEAVEVCSLIDDAETGSTKKLGRPEAPVWVHFKKGKYCNKKKRYHAECKHCSLGVEGRPQTLEYHILHKCPAVSEPVETALDEVLANQSLRASTSKP
jgi:hypothetical protein